MSYTCPVCGYANLIAPPQDHMICPSCGTEFGYDDFAVSHAVLRAAWLAAGAPWFSRHTPQPANWSALTQLLAAGHNYRLAANAVNQSTGNTRAQGLREQLSTLVSTSASSNSAHTTRVRLSV